MVEKLVNNNNPVFHVAFVANTILKSLQDLSEIKAIKFFKGKGKKNNSPNKVFKILHSPIMKLAETLTLRYAIYAK